MFSIYLVKLAVWALSCEHLLAENKVSNAETQLKKFFKQYEMLSNINTISDVLGSVKEKCSDSMLHRQPHAMEMALITSVYLKLSLLHFYNRQFESTDYYLEKSFQTLNCEKYLYPNTYASLQYHKCVFALKKICQINPSKCVKFDVCPSVKCNAVFSRRPLKLDKKIAATCTPVKKKKTGASKLFPTSPLSQKNCRAPVKKDVLPEHLKKDMDISNKSNVTSLMFNSSDDSESPNNLTPHKAPIVNNICPEKLTYKFFKSHNKLNIKSSCDVWKFSDLATPESNKKKTKSKSCLDRSTNVRQSRQRTRNLKSDSNNLKEFKLENSLQTKSRSNRKNILSASSRKKILTDDIHDPLFKTLKSPKMSIEYDRSTPKSQISRKQTKSQLEDDVFCSEDVLQGNTYPICCETAQCEKLSFAVDELCKDLNAVNISMVKEKNVTIPEKNLKEFIDELESARELIKHNAPYPLYVDVCKLLAILKMHENSNYSKQPSGTLDCSFLLSETFASTLQQLHISNVLSNKNKLKDERNHCAMYPVRKINNCIGTEMEHLLNAIPPDYTVVQITSLSDRDKMSPLTNSNISKLVICRYQHDSEPFVIGLDSFVAEQKSSIFSQFRNILLESGLIMQKNEDKKKWWETRSALNGNLKDIVKNMEDEWLGCWKGLLLSKSMNEERTTLLSKISQEISEIAAPRNEQLLHVLLESIMFLSREQRSAAICNLWSCSPFDTIYSKIYKSVMDLSLKLPETERHPLILILDKDIQYLPWESLPILNSIPVSRMPSLKILSSTVSTLRKDSVFKGLDCKNTFYILNPSTDLMNCQTYFQPIFEKQENWKGIVGRVPDSDEWTSALKNYDLFVYCGHGGGRQYLKEVDIDVIKCRAATVLMGCSSGQLKQLGRCLEPQGMPLTYLMNGCPCIIGNLWDVTDKDIDRFTDRLLELIVPKYCPTQNSITDLGTAVSQARNACKMRYLVGAAPIVYGFPIVPKND